MFYGRKSRGNIILYVLVILMILVLVYLASSILIRNNLMHEKLNSSLFF